MFLLISIFWLLLFQETITTTQDPETVDKAIGFGAFLSNLGLMCLGIALVISGYAFKTKDTPVATIPWIRNNMRRFIACGVFIVTLAIAMVAVPDQLANALAMIAIDAKNAAAPFLFGLVLALTLITVTSEPSKNPEG